MIIPIFTDESAQQGGWHGNALKEAFAVRGHEAVLVELQDCLIDLSGEYPCIVLPNAVPLPLPKVAFVRGVAGGSLQQVITRLNMLHMLKMQGSCIYNDAKAIERTVDKGMTSFLLKQHGVATPATWVCESRPLAHQIIKQHLQTHDCMIIKPLFGSQGKGVRRLTKTTPFPLPRDTHVDGVFYLQAFIDSGQHHHDYRVFVINNEPAAAMQRSGQGWLHNVAQGALCKASHEVDVLEIAVNAAKALNIAYCGVDVIRDGQGKLWVLEVNSIPAWRGLQSVTTLNIAQLLVDDLLSKLHG
jgi:tetrahydromethanopterin:alpha-L-glutamate ligase